VVTTSSTLLGPILVWTVEPAELSEIALDPEVYPGLQGLHSVNQAIPLFFRNLFSCWIQQHLAIIFIPEMSTTIKCNNFAPTPKISVGCGLAVPTATLPRGKTGTKMNE